MNIYQDLENSLYDVLEGLFPTWRIHFAYSNYEEQQTPYVVIDVKKLETTGLQYTSHLTEVDPDTGVGATTTFQDSLAQVRFEFVGKYDDNTTTAEMAQQLELALRTPKGFELLKRSRLAQHKKMAARRIPQKRDCDMYMIYQLDCTFAYCSMITEDIDWIAVLGIDGVYHDAALPPDYTIETHLDITTPNP